MQISTERPPIWDAVCAAFNIEPLNACFSYGATLYNPNKLELPEHIIEHEKLHMEQQGHDEGKAALWWGRYLREPNFRVDQEARAYGRQYAFICSYVGDRNARARVLGQLAKSLSGPLYDNAVSYLDAKRMINKRAGF